MSQYKELADKMKADRLLLADRNFLIELLRSLDAQDQKENIEADAYCHACDEMEAWQHKRHAAGKEVGTTGSLCDGIAWLYGYIDKLEALAVPVATPESHIGVVYRHAGGFNSLMWSPGLVENLPVGTRIYAAPVAAPQSLDAQRPTVDEVVALIVEYGTHCSNGGQYAATFDKRMEKNSDNEAKEAFAKLRAAIEAFAAPVAAQPQQAKPLSDAEIWADDGIMSANSRVGASFEALRELVRAVEKRYGIKEQG